MSREATIEFLRTTRANLDTNKSNSNLIVGEPYFITDEQRLAIGTAVNNYIDVERVPRLINTQTGTSYTLVLNDIGKVITLSNASAITLTIPQNSSVAFPVGTQIELVQLGAGAVTVGGSGVTINSKSSNKKTNGQYVAVSLLKTATDTWLLFGDLTT